ncbi:hypothetical protein R1flu_007967 [Riccia fluitans]|uniref:Uncharacterized protein n=1 Tax=Riccia fluitans TaxID=41844 RepID=A0ABD1YDF7_9MARC
MNAPMETEAQQAERLFQDMLVPDAPPFRYRIQRLLRQGAAAMTTLLNMGLVMIFPSNPPLLDRVGSRVDDHGDRRGPCLSIPIVTTDEPGPPLPPVFWPTWGGVQRKFGLGRQDPHMNGAEHEGARLWRDTDHPSAWLPWRWFSPRRGSISFWLAESREEFCYEVYLRIPNREVPSTS